MTKRKSAADKAHTTHRKTAPKSVTKNPRGTHLKTAVKFEELARYAQMPLSMRSLAEKSVVQTRELCERSFETVLVSWDRFVDAGQGAVALNRKAIDIARRNINTGFGLAASLARATNLVEVMELQAAYWNKQLEALAAQAGEIRTFSAKVTADVGAPIRAQI